MLRPDFIKENVKLARFSTLGVGGLARYFVSVNNEEELLEARRIAKESGLDYLVIGGGSNIIFSDLGFDGLIIKINFRVFHYRVEEDHLWVDAGALISRLVLFSEQVGFTGYETFAGLPGTIGGAVYGNAGCYGIEFWENVEAVRFLMVMS